LTNSVLFLSAKSSSKLDKVVRREICSVQTKGTKRLSFIDGDTCESGSQFLLALCEKVCVQISINYKLREKLVYSTIENAEMVVVIVPN
jgi:hypothetical protein